MQNLRLMLGLGCAIVLFSSVSAQAQSHPHLFFDKSGMEAIRERANSNPRLNTMWLKFKRDRVGASMKLVVETPFNQDIGRDYGDALVDLSIAYIITREKQYVSKAREIAAALADASNWGEQLAIAHIGIGFAFAWDVLHDQFSDTERKKIKTSVQNNAANVVNPNPLSNHNWTPSAAEGLVGLAFSGEGGFAKTLLGKAKNNFKEGPGSVLWAHGTDGFSPQGPGYWRKYNHVVLFMTALRFNERQNDWFHLGKEYPGSEFFKNTAMPRIFLDTQHQDLSVVSWGDSPQIGTDRKGPFAGMGLLSLVASEYKDGYALDFMDHLLETGYRFDNEDAAAFILYDDTGVTPKPYQELPLSAYWPNMEAGMFRSGWSKDDLLFFMRCGSPGGHARRIKGLPRDGHNHPDANGFVLFYNNDYLAAEDGAKPDIGPDAGLRITYGHNTLLVDGTGQKGDRGKRVKTTNANMDFLDTEHLGFMLGDATDAYENLDHYFRYVLYKKHKYFIIVDEVSDDLNHSYQFLLGTDRHHFITSKNDDQFTVKPANGNASLPLVFVEPRKIGSSINKDRPSAFFDEMVDLLRVSSIGRRQDATFFALLYPRKKNEPDPDFEKIYDGGRSGIRVDGDEYTLYNKDGQSYTYRSVSTDAKLCYFKDNPGEFEYLAAGARNFEFDGTVGLSSDKALVAAFKGTAGTLRLGKNLGENGSTRITLQFPGITGVLIDGAQQPLTGKSGNSITFTLAPKQYKIGPTGFEQTVTDNYDVQILTGVQPSFVRVTAPNGGEVWQAGSSQRISWTASADFSSVSIDHSGDGGGSWRTIVPDTPNQGSFQWTVPDLPSEQNLIRVTGGSLSDMSDAQFSISSGQEAGPQITSFVPTSGFAGTGVTISGTGFSSASQVRFNGTDAGFAILSDSEITATVPAAATTGLITVANSGGSAVSRDVFTVNTTGGAQLTFHPTDDARVKISSPGRNYGSKSTLKIEQGKFNSFLKFDVTNLSGRVASAKLRMQVENPSNSGGSIYLVSNNFLDSNNEWTEAGLTHGNAPPIAGPILSNLSAVGIGDVVEFDVTQAISASGKYSFALSTNSPDQVQYHSKEGDFVPELIIETTGEPPVQFSLEIATAGQGTVSASPAGGTYDQSAVVTLSASAAAGWRFQEWQGNLTGAQNPTTLRMDSNKKVTAVFVETVVPQYALATTVQGQGALQVTPENGPYDAGTVVELTAVPASGWRFDAWSGDLSGTVNPVSLTMDSDKQIGATFTEVTARQFTLNVSTQGAGTVVLEPAGGTYDAGTRVTITASADNGWRFERWTGDVTGSAAAAEITMDGNKAVTGVFVEQSDEVQVFTFTPVGDTHVKSSRLGSNYGDSDFMRLRRSTTRYNAYLKFQVSGLQGAVRSAVLRLFVTDASNDGGTLSSVSNNYVDSSGPWEELGLTWQNAPPITDSALSSVSDLSIGAWAEFDVAKAVNGNGIVSFGLVSNSSNSARYSSREGSQAPQLVIETIVTPGGVNTPPIARDDQANTRPGLSVIINPLANDTDVDGSLDPKTVEITTAPANGSTAVNPFSGLVTYVPDGGFSGQDSFLYTVMDDSGAVSNQAEVTVEVSSDGGTGELTFTPSDDAQIKLTSPGRNYGSKSSTKVEGDRFLTYLKFDVQGTTAAVSKAVVTLYVLAGSVDGGAIFPVANELQASPTAWTEETLTAGNAPQITGTAFSAADNVTINSFAELDVTNALAGDGIYSFALRSASRDQVKYETKEGSRAPKLTVEFSSTSSILAAANHASQEHQLMLSETPTVLLPGQIALAANYPNPFNAGTTIKYELPEAAEVRISIYNLLAQHIKTLVAEVQSPGFKSVRWQGDDADGRPVGSGIYFVRMKVGNTVLTRKVLLQK